jgi:subtilisin family serine protease
MSPYTRLRFIGILFILLLMTSYITAQDEGTPEVTEEPVIVEETPAPEMTEESPVAEPTVTPPPTPTEVSPDITEEPLPPAPEETEAPEQTTEPEIPAPEVVSAPPVFEIASSLSVEAGQSLSIPFAIYDEQGAVVIVQMVSAAGATTTLEITAPAQASPPYITTGTITYTAVAAFSGTDVLTLTAIDGAGTAAVATIQIEVQPAPVSEATEEATPEAAAEATQEATPEVTPETTPEASPMVERIISYDPAASEESIQALLAALRATEISRIPQIGAMKVLVPEVLAGAPRAMAALQSDQAAVAAGLITIEENIVYQLDAQSGLFNPNDPEFNNGNNQWPLRNFEGSINGQDAWLRSRRDGAGVRVAVLDSGVDLQHPDLVGQIDVVRGWDFFNDDNDPDDDDDPPSGVGGHGTHIAGIIAAKTNNSLYMAGLAYKARIIPVKVCGTDENCPAYEVAAGIVHAVDKGAHIINLSLSGPTISTTMRGAVQYAIARNVTVIAPAGNTGGTALQYPASFPGVISVASHDRDGNTAPSSTQNSSVDLSGPGVNVYSLARLEEGGSAMWSGTSTASAYVTGAAALLYADNIARTPAAIREALICTALDKDAPGEDNAYGFGIAKADMAFAWRAVSSTNCAVPLPNDQFANAMLIRKAPFSVEQQIYERSVTADANDPTDCGASTQTLWYKFIPPANGRYQISSFGTEYNNRLTVYQGVPGAFVLQGSCDTGDVEIESIYYSFEGDSYVSLDMKKGQIYYIILANTGGAVNNQKARLDIRPTLSANGPYDDNHKAIYYYGESWARISVAGSKVTETSTNRQPAVFTFQGTKFDLYRVVGPGERGSIEVWINNQRFDFNTSASGIQNLSNNASELAIATQEINVPNPFYGKQNTVIIRRAETGPSGPIAIDRIVIYNAEFKPFTGKIDDRDSRIDFGNAFWDENWAHPSMFKGTGARTNREGAAVRAVVRGSTIVIYRNIGPNYSVPGGLTTDFGSMEIWVDGVIWGTVNNNHPTYQYSVPLAITNLTPTTHLLRIVNTENKELQIDAIEGLMTTAFAPNTLNSPGDRRALKSGLWWDEPVTISRGKRAYINSSPTARLDFNFTGNAFCLRFMRRGDGGTVHIYVDDMNTPHERLSTHTDEDRWANHFWPPDTLEDGSGIQQYCTGAAFVEGVHHVRLLFPSGSPVWLTGLHFGRFGVLTVKDGLVQENDRRLPTTASLYNTFEKAEAMAALWQRIRVKFEGGAKAQGGYLKRATIDPSASDDPVIRFYMHGTGFIIYTTRGPDAGLMRVQVCEHTDPEDCDPAIMTLVIDLSLTTPNTPNRARPLAYAVNGLEPGVYLIRIFAEGAAGKYVDFDGVRVLP